MGTRSAEPYKYRKRAAVGHPPGTPPEELRHTINMATKNYVVKSFLIFFCLFSMQLQPGCAGYIRKKRQDESASK